MNDPLLSLINPKPPEEIITAAKETIHRHRRRYLQRNLRACPENCKRADLVGSRVVGCAGCGSPNAASCVDEKKFEPQFSKDELARQFAQLIRNPEALLRDYRDVTVFLWVLGAFDKQKRTVNEHIVSKVEQRDDKARKVAVGQAGAVAGGDNNPHGDKPQSGSDNPKAAPGNTGAIPNLD